MISKLLIWRDGLAHVITSNMITHSNTRLIIILLCFFLVSCQCSEYSTERQTILFDENFWNLNPRDYYGLVDWEMIQRSSLRDKREFKAIVYKVLHGDKVLIKEPAKTTVFLAGVDCPDYSTSIQPREKQPYWEEAKKFTEDLINKNQSSITIRNKGLNEIGWITGEIFVGEKNLGHELVKAGLGWWDRKYKDADLKKYEFESRKARKGLWKESSPIPPWEFREKRLSRMKERIQLKEKIQLIKQFEEMLEEIESH